MWGVRVDLAQVEREDLLEVSLLRPLAVPDIKCLQVTLHAGCTSLLSYFSPLSLTILILHFHEPYPHRSLHAFKITDALGGLTNLKTCILQLLDEGGRTISALSDGFWYQIPRLGWSDRHLRALPHSTVLERLELDGCRVPLGSGSSLRRYKNLQSLHLTSDESGSFGLSTIERILRETHASKLRELHIVVPGLSCKLSLAVVGKFRHLTRLLVAIQSDEWIETRDLAELREIEHLDLTLPDLRLTFDARDLRALVPSWYHLKTLRLATTINEQDDNSEMYYDREEFDPDEPNADGGPLLYLADLEMLCQARCPGLVALTVTVNTRYPGPIVVGTAAFSDQLSLNLEWTSLTSGAMPFVETYMTALWPSLGSFTPGEGSQWGTLVEHYRN